MAGLASMKPAEHHGSRAPHISIPIGVQGPGCGLDGCTAMGGFGAPQGSLAKSRPNAMFNLFAKKCATCAALAWKEG